MLRTASVTVIAVFGILGCRSNHAATSAPALPPGPHVDVTVDAQGYHPAMIQATAGQPITLVFRRTSDEGCNQQVVFPSLNIQRDLPLDQAVPVTITPPAGTLAFSCAMGMYRGTVVAH